MKPGVKLHSRQPHNQPSVHVDEIKKTIDVTLRCELLDRHEGPWAGKVFIVIIPKSLRRRVTNLESMNVHCQSDPIQLHSFPICSTNFMGKLFIAALLTLKFFMIFRQQKKVVNALPLQQNMVHSLGKFCLLEMRIFSLSRPKHLIYTLKQVKV